MKFEVYVCDITVEIRELSEPLTVQELNDKIQYNKRINLQHTVFRGTAIKVGDLVYYQTIEQDEDDNYYFKTFYGIIQSIVRYKGEDIIDIKPVGLGQCGNPEFKEYPAIRLNQIYAVCTIEYFDTLVTKIKETTENTIKLLQKDIEEVKKSCEKDLHQIEQLKNMLSKE